MRISLGAVLFFDTLTRMKDLYAHYTDGGVLPRGAFLNLWSNDWFFSLHTASGNFYFEAALFAITLIFALFLMFGYRTKLSTIISWILLISVQNRNPIIMHGGDIIFRATLFWGMFLPLGSRYSADRILERTARPKKKLLFSAATFAYVIQISIFYIFSGFLKNGELWKNGQAIFYALSLDQFARKIGTFLLQFPALLSVMTLSVLYFERFGALLFFSPKKTGPIRTVGVLLFALMQVGINMSMHLGYFGAVSIAVTLALLPPWFWDTLFVRVRKFFTMRGRTGLEIYYDGDCGFCKKIAHILPKAFLLSKETKIAMTQENPYALSIMKQRNSWVVIDTKKNNKLYTEWGGITAVLSYSPLFFPLAYISEFLDLIYVGPLIYRLIARNRSMVCIPFQEKSSRNKWLLYINGTFVVLMAIYITLWNIGTLKKGKALPRSLEPIGWVTRMDQSFDLFAPYPTLEDGWYVIPGTLRNGAEIDVARDGGPVDYKKPDNVYATFHDVRWQKYLINLWRADYSQYRLYYGKYLCRHWNNNHPPEEALEKFSITYMLEKTLPPGEEPQIAPKIIWNHECFK